VDEITRERYPHGLPTRERYRLVAKHPFQAGPHVDGRGARVCERCGSLETERIHRLPDRTEEQRAAEARRMGEGG
jgi:hypothetical protein